jgi:hypothetical protein
LALVGMLVSFVVIRVGAYFALSFKLRHVRWSNFYSTLLLSYYIVTTVQLDKRQLDHWLFIKKENILSRTGIFSMR